MLVHRPELPERRLRLFDATTLVVGSMIGSAIFLALPIMAHEAPSPAVLIGLWVVGGLFTVLGANCCAELAAMLPGAGGQYVFLREAFGNLWAFLFGWPQFLVVQTGFNLGSLVPGCSEKNVLATIPLGNLLPTALQAHLPPVLQRLEINSAQLVASAVIVLLTAVNIRGVREGVWVQNVFTALKVAALAALSLAGLWYGLGSPHFIPPSLPIPTETLGAGVLAGLALALSKALFAYDAWCSWCT